MYLVWLHGQATSCWPGASGAPTECNPLTNAPSIPNFASAAAPIRVMIFIEATTYGESVISMPSLGSSAPSGPMQNGITYMVRPRIQPRYNSVMMARISSGSIQLLVAPASSSIRLQINVRDSPLAMFQESNARALGENFGVHRALSLG